MKFISIFLFLVVSFDDVCALTKDAAVERCQINMKLLENAPGSFIDKDVDAVFKKMIQHLNDVLSLLKKTDDVKEIYVARQSCDNGFKAAQWLVENFALAKKEEAVPLKEAVSTKDAIPVKKEAEPQKQGGKEPTKDVSKMKTSPSQRDSTKEKSPKEEKSPNDNKVKEDAVSHEKLSRK